MEVDAGQAKKSCILCGQKIPASANFCTACKSYQDWRRFLPIGSAAVAFTAAVVSVLAIALPAMIELFGTKDSRLSALAVTSSPGEFGISIAAVNSGNRPGTITSAAAVYAEPDGTQRSFSFEVDDRSANLIDPGTGKLVAMHIGGDSVAALNDGEFDPAVGTCKVIVATMPFSGRPENLPSDVSCSLLMPAISNTHSAKVRH